MGICSLVILKGVGGRYDECCANLACRKKAEQTPLREAIEQQREKNVDVGGVLGQRGGPANPVDRDGYPNATD